MSKLEKLYNKFGEFGNTVLSILKIVALNKKSENIDIANPKNELVILGNGPSLRPLLNDKKEFLEDKDLMVVNFSSVSDDYQDLKPKFYLMMDPLFFNNKEISDKAFIPMVDKTNWEMTLFVSSYSFKYPEWQKLVASNKNIKVVSFNPVPIEGIKAVSHYLYKKQYGMPRPRNVLVACLMVALQKLPYKTIFLGGADHSWLQEIWVDDNNVVHEDRAHFYDKGKTTHVVSNRPIYELIEGMYVAFKSYHQVESFAKECNTKIYNITKGSYIDAFERKSI